MPATMGSKKDTVTTERERIYDCHPLEAPAGQGSMIFAMSIMIGHFSTRARGSYGTDKPPDQHTYTFGVAETYVYVWLLHVFHFSIFWTLFAIDCLAHYDQWTPEWRLDAYQGH